MLKLKTAIIHQWPCITQVVDRTRIPCRQVKLPGVDRVERILRALLMAEKQRSARTAAPLFASTVAIFR